MKRLIPILAVLLLTCPAANAYIEAFHPLGRICKESSNIVLLEVQRVNAEKNLIVYRKVKDLKGTHSADIKHNIGQRGFHPREWQTIMAWAKEGKQAVFFHNGNASLIAIDNYWYQCIKEGEWWTFTHAEPFVLRSYYGPVDRLIPSLGEILADKEAVVPAMADGPKEQLHLREGKVHRIRASLKLQDFNAKRDVVAQGDDPKAVAAATPAVSTPKPSRPAPAPANPSRPAAPAAPEKLPPEVIVDKAARRISLPCSVAPRKLAHLNDIYPLEVIATYPAPKGQKAHETVVTFKDVKPSQLHAALESIGLKPGKPARGEGSKATGPELRIRLEVPDQAGKPRRIPIEQIMIDRKGNKPVPALTWHFTGSNLRQIDPESDQKSYGADTTGTLISIFPVTDDTVIQSSLTSRDEAAIKLEIAPNTLPKEGTPLRLIIDAK